MTFVKFSKFEKAKYLFTFPLTKETDKYFTLPSYNFNTKTKFILFEQLINRKKLPTEILQERLKDKENFRTIKLKAQLLRD